MSANTIVVWLRTDGLVGHGPKLPQGFGDCGFSALGTFADDAEAERYILSLPTVTVNGGGFWKVTQEPESGQGQGM